MYHTTIRGAGKTGNNPRHPLPTRYIRVMGRSRFRSAALPAVLLVMVLAVGAGFSPAAEGQTRRPLVTFEKSRITILSGDRSHAFRVELAQTARQHAQGLMYRRHMAADAGMLFIHRRPAPRSMWMKNTYIPLDMLFLGTDGTILGIAERTVPLSTRAIRSGRPAIAVLELNAGTVARLGLREGDRVVSPDLPGTR